MQLSPDAFGYLFIILFWLGFAFIAFKLITKASKHLFSFFLLYGLAFSGTAWQIIFLLMQGTNPFEALEQSGMLYFGVVIPTAALDKLVATELAPLAILLLFVWWIALITTFAKKDQHFFLSDIVDAFGRYRIFGAALLGTIFWIGFGFGLPNFCSWLTESLSFPFNPFVLFLAFFIASIGFLSAEVALRIKTGERGLFDVFGLLKGMKKAVKGN